MKSEKMFNTIVKKYSIENEDDFGNDLAKLNSSLCKDFVVFILKYVRTAVDEVEEELLSMKTKD